MFGIVLVLSISMGFLHSHETNELNKILNYFETLKTTDFTVRVRNQRSVDERVPPSIKLFSFYALGRNFNLVLKAGSPVLAHDFKAKAVYSDGRITLIDVNTEDFFIGHLAEDDNIYVDAFYEGDVLCTCIYFPNETYVTEPSWRHLPPSKNHSVIAYRVSDVKWDDFEAFPEPATLKGLNTDLPDVLPLVESATTERETLYTKENNSCSLLVVADYRFSREQSFEGRLSYVVQTIAGIVQLANSLFRRTVFKDGLTNMGFYIKDMLIHQDYTDIRSHYNTPDRSGWNVQHLLKSFSLLPTLDKYCLGHLFTSYSFKSGVVGLAFLSSSGYSAGGLCSHKPIYDDDFSSKYLIPNTGFTSTRNGKGQFLLLSQRNLVTSHELGHNWGSPHDSFLESRYNRRGKCGPDDDDGGKFLMWPYSVSGEHVNNFFFSPCSIDIMSDILMAKSDKCFSEKPGDGWCGDGSLNSREQCDVGLVTTDPCCTHDCMLRTNATCSDFNFDCCYNCQIAPKGYKCSDENVLACQNASYCTGTSLKCPKPAPVKDGTPCLDKGTCQGDSCVSYCTIEAQNHNQSAVPCLCQQNSTAACRYCCRSMSQESLDSLCLPTEFILEASRYCYLGYCDENGICVTGDVQFIAKLFIFFETLTVNKIVAFMKTNIVFVVIILTTVLWIPASIATDRVDQKRKQKLDDVEKQLSQLFHSVSQEQWVKNLDRDMSLISFQKSRSYIVSPQGSFFTLIQMDRADPLKSERMPASEDGSFGKLKVPMGKAKQGTTSTSEDGSFGKLKVPVGKAKQGTTSTSEDISFSKPVDKDRHGKTSTSEDGSFGILKHVDKPSSLKRDKALSSSADNKHVRFNRRAQDAAESVSPITSAPNSPSSATSDTFRKSFK